MLAKLHIKNIAVIDEVDVEFFDGFNVLTGETGAGKSIIIDSINMVLGERTSRELIRTGEKKALVEALFYLNNETVMKTLSQMGIETEDGALLIYRDMNQDGRGVCKVNGQMVTASMLKDIARLIINIHGQQDSQSLLQPNKHIEFLDSYSNTGELLEEYRLLYIKGKEIEKQLKDAESSEQDKAHKIDLYTFQLQEIEGANLKKDEEETLIERRNYLNSIGKISTVLDGAIHSLYSNDDSNVHDILSRLVRSFSEIAPIDNKLSEIYKALDSISIDLDDAIYQIRDYSGDMEFSPVELDTIELRLDLIHKLKRKYGATIAEILEYADKIDQELQMIKHSEEHIKQLSRSLEENLKLQTECAAKLTQVRTKSAISLEEKIKAELSELDMNKIEFKVSITPCDFNQNGADNIEFLISTNVGEGLKPLSKIASGGEMSRIMLAIKSVLADNDVVETLIFDEIDTGVSGRAAQKIGEKISKISSKYQLLCITHLAQIASMADSHFLIEKKVTDDKTKTTVSLLSDVKREEELARIIGGAKITELTLKNAQEMLRLAKDMK